MSLASIIALRLDDPPLTAQELADQALTADRTARHLARHGDAGAAQAREEADQIADECAKRALREFLNLSI